MQGDHLDARLLRGRAFSSLLQGDAALEDFDAALKTAPTNIEALESRAAALASLGRVDEAKRQYFDVLGLGPTHVIVLQTLCGLPGLSDAELADLDRHLDLAGTALARKKGNHAINLDGARQEIAMRRGASVEAMLHLSRAKAQAARSHPFDDAAAERKCKAVMAITDLPSACDPDTALPRPIFVVGLPRSGTTLMKMTLGAHPSVQGCGKLATVGNWAERNTQITSADSLTPFYRAMWHCLCGARISALPKWLTPMTSATWRQRPTVIADI